MKPLVCVSIAFAVAGLPAVVIAQVAQTYSYDTNGGLTGVTTTGPGGTNTAAYTYDNANNRTSRSQTGTAAYAALSRWPVHENLQPLHALVSPDARYSLAVRNSAALELWPGKSAAWSNSTEELARRVFTVDNAGNVRFRGIGGEEGRTADAYFALGDERDFAQFDDADATVLLLAIRNSNAEPDQ